MSYMAAMARPAKVDTVMSTVKQESVQEIFERIQNELHQYSEDLGLPQFKEYNPLTAMAKMAINPATPPELRLRCHSELASYMYPKLKSLEMALPPGSEAKITIELTSYAQPSSNTNTTADDDVEDEDKVPIPDSRRIN